MGTLARHLRRRWRRAAHEVFDPLWAETEDHEPPMSRGQAYAWLASVTGVYHIGECDEAQCLAVIQAVAERGYEPS